MGWSLRCLKDMKIWFNCFDFLNRKKKKTLLLCGLPQSKYQYSYSEMYLGAKGKVRCLEKGVEFSISFSVRDGMLAKIKVIQPYRVLFDYVDGAYFINDEIVSKYEWLIDEFSKLRKEKNLNYPKIYEKMEEIVYICESRVKTSKKGHSKGEPT